MKNPIPAESSDIDIHNLVDSPHDKSPAFKKSINEIDKSPLREEIEKSMIIRSKSMPKSRSSISVPESPSSEEENSDGSESLSESSSSLSDDDRVRKKKQKMVKSKSSV